MTTIAYKDGTMAGDRQVSNATGNVFGFMTKVYKDEEGNLLGGCGEATDNEKMKQWMSAPPDEEGNSIPIPFDSLSKDADFIYVVAETGKVFSLSRDGIFEVDGECFTVGSGQQIAKGAMYAGASAKEAVEIAKQLDNNTGGDIDVLYLGGST